MLCISTFLFNYILRTLKGNDVYDILYYIVFFIHMLFNLVKGFYSIFIQYEYFEE